MKEDVCPLCGGVKTDSSTSFTVDFNAEKQNQEIFIAKFSTYSLAS